MSEASQLISDDPWRMPLDRIDVSRAVLVGEPRRVPNNFIRGIADLPVRLHAR